MLMNNDIQNKHSFVDKQSSCWNSHENHKVLEWKGISLLKFNRVLHSNLDNLLVPVLYLSHLEL